MVAFFSCPGCGFHYPHDDMIAGKSCPDCGRPNRTTADYSRKLIAKNILGADLVV